jgi:hypothetical protein
MQLLLFMELLQMYDLALGTTRYGVGGISHAHGTT